MSRRFLGETVRFDIRSWGLVVFTDHPLIHDYMLAIYSQEFIDFFANHGYGVQKEVAIDTSLSPNQVEVMNHVCQIDIPKNIAMAFKLRFHPQEAPNV